MKETDYTFYRSLKSNSISLAQIPKRVKNSLPFRNLVDAKIISFEKSGRGSKIIVIKEDKFESFIQNNFPDEIHKTQTKSSNIRKFRDSKASKIESPAIFFLRGFKNIWLNGENIDLKKHVIKYGLFSVSNPIIQTDKVCFVENLETFLKAEKLFGEEWIFLHKYGRIGIDSLKNISANEIIVFVDYDFNGLDEYLRIQSVFPNAKFYIPENFDSLFEQYGKAISGNQKQTKKVANSERAEVIFIRELVSKNNRFLEQEILIND